MPRRGARQILLLGLHPRAPAPAAILYAIGLERQTLDIVLARDGNHHVFLSNEILNVELLGTVDDLGAALFAEALGDLIDLVLDDLHLPVLAGEDALEVFDRRGQFFVLVFDIVEGDAQAL